MTILQCSKELQSSRVYVFGLIKSGRLKATQSTEKRKEWMIDPDSFYRFKTYRDKMRKLKKELNNTN